MYAYIYPPHYLLTPKLLTYPHPFCNCVLNIIQSLYNVMCIICKHEMLQNFYFCMICKFVRTIFMHINQKRFYTECWGFNEKNTSNILFVIIKYIYKKPPKTHYPDQSLNVTEVTHRCTLIIPRPSLTWKVFLLKSGSGRLFIKIFIQSQPVEQTCPCCGAKLNGFMITVLQKSGHSLTGKTSNPAPSQTPLPLPILPQTVHGILFVPPQLPPQDPQTGILHCLLLRRPFS